MDTTRQSRRDFLKRVGAGAAALAGLDRLPAALSGQPGRPNIILVMLDDMGFSDIGCYGSEIPTPNIDRLAANGLRFTQFYNTARCCPTRASLLTGLYSHQTGIGQMTDDKGWPGYRGFLNRNCVTIAEVLRPAGYRTFIAGKWHVGSENKAWWPLQRGFDRFFGVPEGGGFYFKPKGGRTVVLDNNVAYDENSTMPDGWYTTDAFTDYGITFVEEAVERRQPFFFYLAYNAPHWPLQAIREDIERHRGRYMVGWDALRQQRHQRMTEMGLVDEGWPLSPRDPEASAWEDVPQEKKRFMDWKMAIYAAQIERVDRNIGRLVRRLEELGVFDNTLILFLADNGGCAEGGIWGFDRMQGQLGSSDSDSSYGQSWANASDTPFKLYKHWVHEGGIASPLIAHWPGRIRDKGALRHQVGHVIDLMATCLDAAGVEYPTTHQGNDILPLEGKSLVPAFNDKPVEREALYWEHEGNRAVRCGRWKLVSKYPGDWELYDLEADRTELRNLAQEHPDKAEELRQMYDRWARRCGVRPWPVKKATASS